MKKIIALAVAAVVAAPAMADLTIGADARYQAQSGAAAGSDFASSANRVNVTFAGRSEAESGMFAAATVTLQLTGDAGVGRDNDNSVTIGNSAANVVLGAFEPAGSFSSGGDMFEVGAIGGYEGGLRARSAQNIGLNLTAIEGVTAQVSTDINNADDVRLVVGTAMGGFNATAGFAFSDDADQDGVSITVGTTVGGVALNASYGKSESDNSSTNFNASFMGLSLAVQNDETAGVDAQSIYGTYALPAMVPGLAVTVGAGTSDDTAETNYGVRVAYAF